MNFVHVEIIQHTLEIVVTGIDTEQLETGYLVYTNYEAPAINSQALLAYSMDTAQFTHTPRWWDRV